MPDHTGTSAEHGDRPTTDTTTSEVTIPRAQYEALMAAAKSLHDMYHSGTNRNLWVAHNALAALRAAGCLEDGE